MTDFIYFTTELLAEEYALSLGTEFFEVHFDYVAKGYTVAVFNEHGEYTHNIKGVL